MKLPVTCIGKDKQPLPLTTRQRQMIDESLKIEQKEARSAGSLGFMSRALVQVTLPHKDPKTLYYERTNGKLSLTVRGHKAYGVPFGTIPRIVLAWMSTEAVRTKDPTLHLGCSASDFSSKLGLHYNGNDLARLKKQSLALARSAISIDCHDKSTNSIAFDDIKITSRGFVFWTEKNIEQPSLWQSTLTLTDDFYNAVTTRPMPMDMRVYQALSKSPLAMDIYTWLTYRVFILRVSGHKQALILWLGLKEQLGNGYANNADGLASFKFNFKKQLKKVLLFYPEVRECLIDVGKYLKMLPCKLHIANNNEAKLSKLEN